MFIVDFKASVMSVFGDVSPTKLAVGGVIATTIIVLVIRRRKATR